ncbi:MAG: ATP-grasp domain-containing protein, partial [Dichotomicrobium sp.]
TNSKSWSVKNIFVIGLEPFNLALLRTIQSPDGYSFISLLDYDVAVHPPSGVIDFTGLLSAAEEQLAENAGAVDAIISYWDFPSSGLRPVLCRRHGLPGPAIEAVARCEHKYWSRLEQRRAVPELVPGFCAVDPFADDPLEQIDVPYPFWIKPVKAHSSYLGFMIHDERDFREAIPTIRENIHRFGDAFNAFLDLVEMPPEVARIGGNHCVAEQVISAGEQCTLEGYVWQGDVVVYGVVDSVRSGKHKSSFSRYQYPSKLPANIRERMIAATKRVLDHIGYDNAPFNVEFYWDQDSDAIRLLEINTRISKSHSPLFWMVDGATHQSVAIDLALGRRPDFPHRRGRHALAAKFMLRVFEDAVVRRVPDDSHIQQLKQEFPDAMVRVLTKEGQRLRHLHYQDSYSFELAEIFLGAEDEQTLLEKYRVAVETLPFELEPLEPAEA